MNLLDTIDQNELSSGVRAVLEEACRSWESGGQVTLLAAAETAQQIARECGDSVGEGTALILAGVAHLDRRDFFSASRVFERAQKAFHWDPSWRQRRNEAVALAGAALASMGDGSVSGPTTVANLQKALDLLEKTRFFYGARGEQLQLRVIDRLSESLRFLIRSEARALVQNEGLHDSAIDGNVVAPARNPVHARTEGA